MRGEILRQRRKLRQQSEQRFRGNGLDDEPVAFLSHDGVLTRKLKLTGNSHGLVPSILEDFDVAFGAGFGAPRWHMSSMLTMSFVHPGETRTHAHTVLFKKQASDSLH